jgi:hypothetical protein
MSSRFVLMVGFYRDPDPVRMRELLTCLSHNLGNALIDEMHVHVEERQPGRKYYLLEEYPVLAHPKVRLVDHGRRVSYWALFDRANQKCSGRRVIIANADIYFDNSLAQLDRTSLEGKLLCLSRWDVQPDGSTHLFAHTFSQDAWIFQAPMRPFKNDFLLGLPRCDNRIAWEAQRAGLAVSNPSHTVRAYHLHLSGIRNYTAKQEIRGDGLGIVPTALEA